MTYEAIYLIAGTDATIARRFDVCDDFLHAVEQAEDAREKDEKLMRVYAAPAPSRILTPLDRLG